jgi:hypothetical protein
MKAVRERLETRLVFKLLIHRRYNVTSTGNYDLASTGFPSCVYSAVDAHDAGVRRVARLHLREQVEPNNPSRGDYTSSAPCTVGPGHLTGRQETLFLEKLVLP